MEEVDPEADDFGVQLRWPADALTEPAPLNTDAAPDGDEDRAVRPPAAATGGGSSVPRAARAAEAAVARMAQALAARLSAGFDDVMAELREQRRRQTSATAEAKTSASESAASVRRLAESSLEISKEV